MWSDSDTEKLNKIFEIIKSDPTIHHVDLNKKFYLKCDASQSALGSIPTQENKIVDIYSKKFNEHEIKYSNTEKEALAIIKSLLHFRYLIYNSKIIIFTDNKNLLFQDALSQRINRLKLILEEFDYE
ncbi:Transposon Tf2-11 polyprotein [Dictyocoela muelleri]|nr:Transposon Tf2-11 polyprotein [Dictyocoela muelleri]